MQIVNSDMMRQIVLLLSDIARIKQNLLSVGESVLQITHIHVIEMRLKSVCNCSFFCTSQKPHRNNNIML